MSKLSSKGTSDHLFMQSLASAETSTYIDLHTSRSKHVIEHTGFREIWTFLSHSSMFEWDFPSSTINFGYPPFRKLPYA